MLFNIALFSSLLLVPAVLAVPSALGARAVSDTEYSRNWAGAVWVKDNGTFTFITGTFTVPTPSGSTGASASAFVGIDGDTCPGGYIQTGVDFTVSSGGPEYTAWYQWFPAPTYAFSDMTVSAGDAIRLTVIASSATSGTATIENLTTDKTVFKSLTFTDPLCGQNAEWIVQADQESFADFGTVTFTDAVATGNGIYTPSGAIPSDIKQNNTVLTSTSINGSSVTIKYV